MDKYTVLALRLLLRYLELQGLPPEQAVALRKYLKNRKSNPDMFVPSDEQVLDTLRKLSAKNRILFGIYLCSGLRKNEGQYLYEHLPELKVQHCDGFVKVNIAAYRKTKTAYFCYLPTWLYELLQQHRKELSVRSLDNITTTQKLVAAKYARKWFFTKGVELGIPESIADFYEGRTSTSIGATHYLAKQSLADRYYPLVVKNTQPMQLLLRNEENSH